MLPDRCSVTESGKQCVNTPEFVVSVMVHDDEYMVGVTCDKHRQVVTSKIQILQTKGTVPPGKVIFTRLKAVGTDCIRTDSDDYIRIDHNSS